MASVGRCEWAPHTVLRVNSPFGELTAPRASLHLSIFAWHLQRQRLRGLSGELTSVPGISHARTTRQQLPLSRVGRVDLLAASDACLRHGPGEAIITCLQLIGMTTCYLYRAAGIQPACRGRFNVRQVNRGPKAPVYACTCVHLHLLFSCGVCTVL